VWLNIWFTFYPRSHYLILKAEDYFAEPQATLKRIFAYLELAEPSEDEWTQILGAADIRPAASGKDIMPEARDLVNDFYEPFNNDLVKLLEDKKWLWT
jgi:hypothetical protein